MEGKRASGCGVVIWGKPWKTLVGNWGVGQWDVKKKDSIRDSCTLFANSDSSALPRSVKATTEFF
jgi:hypothetical protein